MLAFAPSVLGEEPGALLGVQAEPPQPAVHHEVLVGGLSTKHRLPVSKILADKREYQTAAGCRTAQIMHRLPHGRLGQVLGRAVNYFSIVAISARRAGDHLVLSRRRFDRSTAADVAPRDRGPVANGSGVLGEEAPEQRPGDGDVVHDADNEVGPPGAVVAGDPERLGRPVRREHAEGEVPGGVDEPR